GERGEQARAVGFPIRLSGLDEAHLQAGDAAETFGQRRARGLGLLHTVAEFLARALVDDDGGDRGERIAILAGDRGIGEREHEQRERDGTDEPRAGARKHEQERERERNRDRRPYDVRGYEGREGDTEIQTFTFPFLSLGPLTHQSCAGLTRASIP